MLDNPFDFAAIVIAIVAFIFARKAMNQAAALRTRLDLMQQLAADEPFRHRSRKFRPPNKL